MSIFFISVWILLSVKYICFYGWCNIYYKHICVLVISSKNFYRDPWLILVKSSLRHLSFSNCLCLKMVRGDDKCFWGYLMITNIYQPCFKLLSFYWKMEWLLKEWNILLNIWIDFLSIKLKGHSLCCTQFFLFFSNRLSFDHIYIPSNFSKSFSIVGWVLKPKYLSLLSRSAKDYCKSEKPCFELWVFLLNWGECLPKEKITWIWVENQFLSKKFSFQMGGFFMLFILTLILIILG